MTHRGKLVLPAIAALLVLACSVLPHSGADLDEEAKVASRVEATLTAEGFQSAAVRATETVQAGNDQATAVAEAPTASFATPVGVSEMPVIDAFECDPCVVDPGSSAALNWDVSGAITVTLDGRGVASPGSVLVKPDQSSTYKLQAVNEVGRSEKSLTVVVSGAPMIHYFTCLPCELSPGELATLSWDLSGGTAAYLDGEGVPAPGSVEVAPGKTTTYRLEAVGERGSVERLVTVVVREGGDPAAIEHSLSTRGYQVRSVGFQPLVDGDQAAAVVMMLDSQSVDNPVAISDQYYWGMKSLYDNYPGDQLAVGLYDGTRYLTIALVSSSAFESVLRGELDRSQLWQRAGWHVWDEWKSSWMSVSNEGFGPRDFQFKSFSK